MPVLVRAARRVQHFIPSELLEEMEEIADGAGLPYDAVLLENVFLTMAEQTDRRALLSLPVRCSNVVAFGEATSMGQLIHGSTLDWGMRDVLRDRTVVTVVEPERGHPFVSIGWPGMVGTLRAMGAQGLAVSEESCAAPDDTTWDGLPVNMLLRLVVQHEDDLDGAVARARRGPGTCGYKITISDGRRLDARVVEVTARRSHVRVPQRGLVFGCDPEAEASCFEGACDPAIPRNDRSSARRYPVVRSHLEERHGRLRLRDVTDALARTDGRVFSDHTLFACAFEPQHARFSVAMRDDLDAQSGTMRWRTHDLLGLLRPDVARRYAPPWPVNPSRASGEIERHPLSTPRLRVVRVTLSSPAGTGRAHHDAIRGELWMPVGAWGAVVLLPPWKARDLTGERMVALSFARRGLATFVMPLPGQAQRAEPGRRWGETTFSHDLARTRESLLQGAADAAAVADWLGREEGFPPATRAIMGVSLGGHVAAIAMGAYPERFAAGAFLLTGSGIERAILDENDVTRGVRRHLDARGVTEDEARDVIAAVQPAAYARPERAEDVLLVACREDTVVRAPRVQALADAWGGARIAWYDGDHYGLLRSLPAALSELVDHWHRRLRRP
jgi:dienelactone hydrolase